MSTVLSKRVTVQERLSGGNSTFLPPLDSQASAHEYMEPASENILDRFRVSSKVVCAAQFKMPQKTNVCEACEIANITIRKLKEQIRSLRTQLNRGGDRRMMSSTAPSTTLTESSIDSPVHDRKGDDGKYDSLVKKCAAFEAEITRLRQMLNDDTVANEEARQALKMESDIKSGELNRALGEVNELNDKLKSSESERSEMTKTVNDQEIMIDDLRGKMKKLQQYFEEGNKKEKLQIENLLQTCAHASTENENLKQKILSLEIALKTALAETSTLADYKMLIAQLQDTIIKRDFVINQRGEEINKLNDDMDALKAELEKLKNSIKEKDNAMKTLKTERNKALEDLTNSSKRLSELVKKVTIDSDLSAQALEKAISGSVRLCVVAPTVNVHIGDKKLKFQSKASEDELKKFLEDEVLSKYVAIFAQSGDDLGPDKKTNLREWVTRLLGEMQASVESHVTTALKGNSQSATSGASPAGSRRGSVS